MVQIRIEPFRPNLRLEAARTLARAFVTNPLHVAAFGGSQLGKNEVFFAIVVSVMRGPKLIATDGSDVVGFIHWVRSPSCQFSALEKLRLFPALLKGLGPRSARRLSSWLSVWARHDATEPHVHLGPIGVSPEAQGRRIGHRLMEEYCSALDRSGESGYLETDRSENVAFYQRFGFGTRQTIPVLGVPNYLMWREAKREPAA